MAGCAENNMSIILVTERCGSRAGLLVGSWRPVKVFMVTTEAPLAGGSVRNARIVRAHMTRLDSPELGQDELRRPHGFH